MKYTRPVRCLSLALCALAALCLAGCSCNHQWQEATCTAPKTCTRCGETQGEKTAHVFGDSTCIAPEPCALCGTLEGIELTHQWREDGKLCLLCGLDKRNADEQFIEGLAQGLSESWAVVHPEDEALALIGEAVITKAEQAEAFSLEYDRLLPLKEANFRDGTLGQWARIYIETMESAIAALDLYGTEDWDAQYTNWIYHDRTLALYKINEICPIPVPESDEAALSMLLDNGRIINAVNELCEGINFHNFDNTNGLHKHEAFVKNTTGLDFKTFELTVELTDDNGKVLETKSFPLKNWKAGEEKTFSFVSKLDFKNIEIPYATWILKTPKAETETPE